MAGENGSQENQDQLTPEQKAAAEAAANAGDQSGKGEKQDMIPHAKFHEERKKRQELQAKLDAMEAAKVEAERKAAEEAGEFKKLYETESAKVKTLEQELLGQKTKLSEYETKAQARIDKQIESVKIEADRDVIKNILKGKDFADQEALLLTLLEKFGVAKEINVGPAGAGGKGADDRASKEEEAKKSGNVMGLIKNAPVVGKKG